MHLLSENPSYTATALVPEYPISTTSPLCRPLPSLCAIALVRLQHEKTTTDRRANKGKDVRCENRTLAKIDGRRIVLFKQNLDHFLAVRLGVPCRFDKQHGMLRRIEAEAVLIKIVEQFLVTVPVVDYLVLPS